MEINTNVQEAEAYQRHVFNDVLLQIYIYFTSLQQLCIRPNSYSLCIFQSSCPLRWYHKYDQPSTLHTQQTDKQGYNIWTRKATPSKAVQNDASTRQPNLSLASCDSDLWTPDAKSWSFRAVALWTTCANLHQNPFSRFQNTVFTSLVSK